MSRTITINPVTRIEGHAKVHIDLDDAGKATAAYLHVLEFRGFECFVQGMQVELMPTITSRICGTCPHAHHLVAAKCLDKVFSAPPPRPAVLLRELLNAGSMIHSHAIHFFALAGPDLFLGLSEPRARRNLVTLLDAAPDLARKALRLRSVGQRIAEIVGGRGTHPVTAIAGGMAGGLSADARQALKGLAAEGLEIAKVAVEEGKRALSRSEAIFKMLPPLPVHDMGTVKNGVLDLYDGSLRVRTPDGGLEREFEADAYASHMVEQALPFSYGKQVLLKANPKALVYRVGPLARINCADSIETPLANAELEAFRKTWGRPCHQVVLGHYARLIELLYCAEKAVMIANDDSIGSTDLRTKPSGTPRSAVAHIEAPRGVLIHDYHVDANGIIQSANFLVATQHNVASINTSIKAAADSFVGQSDDALLDGVEFAIRCYDPCLSCSTHKIGQMPLDLTLARDGQVIRSVKR
ncbi:MAG: Ni/Fe hydrogenase subunit alpha [Polyangiaceae bacterium]|jgi:F420-non-reducing hydrogenase large subunit